MAILQDLVVVPINSGKYLRSYSKGDRIGSYVMHSVFNVSSGATEISFDIYQHVRRGGGGFSRCIGTGRVIKDKLICNPRSLIRRVEVNRGTDSSVSPVATCLHRDIIILRRVSVLHHPFDPVCMRACACVYVCKRSSPVSSTVERDH